MSDHILYLNMEIYNITYEQKKVHRNSTHDRFKQQKQFISL